MRLDSQKCARDRHLFGPGPKRILALDGGGARGAGGLRSPWTINSEIKKLIGDGTPQGKLFRFFRYDIRLEQEWADNKLGIQVSANDIERLGEMDDPSNVERLYKLARGAARYQIKDQDWESATPFSSRPSQTDPVS